MSEPLVNSRFIRVLYQLGALLCIALGIIGFFLPLLPTTVFLLMAAWLSIRSSPRLHHWLLNHSTLGPPLKQYLKHRSISPTIARRAILTLWLSIGISVYLLNPLWLKALLLLVGAGVTGYLMRLCLRYKAHQQDTLS